MMLLMMILYYTRINSEKSKYGKVRPQIKRIL